MTRRRFAFWLGFGLFTLSDKLRLKGLDRVAAAAMQSVEQSSDDSPRPPAEHWSAAENKTWKWFERENLIDGRWVLTGITTPIHKQTGRPYLGRSGYLDVSLVPEELRSGQASNLSKPPAAEADDELDAGKASATRRARHGRPPSKWLRSLYADEIRIWLQTIEVPEAGVSGMTYWTHLTRDHAFDPVKIKGLTIAEQARLHAAAHYGY